MSDEEKIDVPEEEEEEEEEEEVPEEEEGESFIRSTVYMNMLCSDAL
jgi:hypothetical protein